MPRQRTGESLIELDSLTKTFAQIRIKSSVLASLKRYAMTIELVQLALAFDQSGYLSVLP
jgi:hypothetical protein